LWFRLLSKYLQGLEKDLAGKQLENHLKTRFVLAVLG
jgi:hypothetical protein